MCFVTGLEAVFALFHSVVQMYEMKNSGVLLLLTEEKRGKILLLTNNFTVLNLISIWACHKICFISHL